MARPARAVAATACVSTLVGGILLSLAALLLSPAVGALFRSHQIGVVAAALSGLLFLHAAPVVPYALLQRRLSLRPRLIVEPSAAAVQGIVTGIASQRGSAYGLSYGRIRMGDCPDGRNLGAGRLASSKEQCFLGDVARTGALCTPCRGKRTAS